MLKILTSFGVNNCRAVLPDIFTKQSNITSEANLLRKSRSNRVRLQIHRNFYLLSNSCLFQCSSRHLSSEGYQIDERKDFAFFWENYQNRVTFKRRCINKITKALNCSVNEAKLLTEKEPRIFLDEIDNTIEKIDYLVGRNIPISFTQSNLWILHMKIPDLECRLNAMKNWGIDERYHNEVLALLRLPYVDFFRMSSSFIAEKRSAPHGNRIVFLAKALNCPVREITQRFLAHQHLFYKDLDKLITSLKTYQEYGIDSKDLVKDILALKSSEELIRSRLSKAVERGVTPLRPWMVRCPDDVFLRTVELKENERNALEPFKSREEYLIHALKLDNKMMDTIRSRFPAFFRVRITKLKEMFDFLLGAGYSPSQLCVNPRIVHHSLNTLQERLAELKTAGLDSPSLHILCKNEKDYLSTVHRLAYFKSLKDDERVPSPKQFHG